MSGVPGSLSSPHWCGGHSERPGWGLDLICVSLATRGGASRMPIGHRCVFLGNMSVKVRGLFFIADFFLLLSFRSSLCLLEVSPLSDVSLASIFSLSAARLFILLTRSHRTEVGNFSEVQLISYFSHGLRFWCLRGTTSSRAPCICTCVPHTCTPGPAHAHVYPTRVPLSLPPHGPQTPPQSLQAPRQCLPPGGERQVLCRRPCPRLCGRASMECVSW